ncbi:MAG: PilZ domain-containing protein [Proteobacteria bacterium]|nr:PilZ domain-containing protein [Pseudomonadota bacterium]
MATQNPIPRATVRLRRLKEGRVIFNDRKSVMSCLVRDLSEGGFRLKIGEPFRVPENFELEIHGQPPRPARKVWIGVGELGAAFA